MSRCLLCPDSRFVQQLSLMVARIFQYQKLGVASLRETSFQSPVHPGCFLFFPLETTAGGRFSVYLFLLLWGAKVRTTCRPEIPNIFFSSISLLLRKPVNQLKHLTWGNTEMTFNSETNCLWIAKENSSAAWKGSGSKRRGQEGGF